VARGERQRPLSERICRVAPLRISLLFCMKYKMDMAIWRHLVVRLTALHIPVLQMPVQTKGANLAGDSAEQMPLFMYELHFMA
jgi:hypothetical protein